MFLLKLVPVIITIWKGSMNNDQITTYLGWAKAATLILGLVGVSIAPESVAKIIEGGIALYALLTGIAGHFTNKPDTPNVK